MKIRQEVIRSNGKEDTYEWAVKHLGGNEYSCPDNGFEFNTETGKTNLHGITLGEWKISGRRKSRYSLIQEDAQETAEPQEETTEEIQEEEVNEAPTTLVEEWKYEDGTVKTHKEFANGQLWEKGSHKRLYLDSYGRGAYVDLKANTFHHSKGKAYPVGEWIKGWGAKVEYRYTLQ